MITELRNQWSLWCGQPVGILSSAADFLVAVPHTHTHAHTHTHTHATLLFNLGAICVCSEWWETQWPLCTRVSPAHDRLEGTGRMATCTSTCARKLQQLNNNCLMHGTFVNKTVVAWKTGKRAPPPPNPTLLCHNLNLPQIPAPDTLHQHETDCLCKARWYFRRKH